jgi:hypothetical protein
MEDAPTTVLKFDLYGKLSGLSAKFKELWGKGQQEEPYQRQTYGSAGASPAGASTGTAAGGQSQSTRPESPQIAGAGEKPVFCGQCGAKNPQGTKFCGSCGAKM